jgi:hypothetical protein
MKKFIYKLKSIFVPQEVNGFEPPALRQPTLLGYGLGILVLKIIIILFIVYFPRTEFFAAINAQNLVNLINQSRQTQNLSLLEVNTKLNQAASLKAQDMITNDYFDHTSPSGVSPWYWFSKAGYSFVWAGENLAIHFTDTNAVFDAWMASAGHRDNILNPNFKEIGVAVAEGEINERPTTVAVLDFGSPSAVGQKTVVQAKTNDSTQSPSQNDNKTQENIPAAKQKTATEGNINLAQAPLAELSLPSKVLGTLTINFVELAKSLYLYFSLFLLIALAINILVKIRIQHITTIILTLILIGVSASLIFV